MRQNLTMKFGLLIRYKLQREKCLILKYKGKFFGDSQFIMNILAKEFSIDLDRNLSDEQKAISHIVRRMLEEATYFHILWNRWGVDDNWHAIKSVFFASMPPLVKHVMPEFLRRSVKRTAFGQGVARHSDEENENIFVLLQKILRNILLINKNITQKICF
jgi:hypothetical protein